LLTRMALEAGHEVTAFTRRAAPTEDGSRVVVGDLQDVSAVGAALAGQDAVLSALGGRPWRRHPPCAPAIRNIGAAMTKHGVRRIIAMSTLGAGDTRADIGWFARNILFGFILRIEVADKEAMEDYLASTNLDWTIVRVGILSDGPAKADVRGADDHTIRGMGGITRENVAKFMLEQLENREWVRRKPVIVQY
jgi:uncharacterized protein YbjT (DUF2867 family)